MPEPLKPAAAKLFGRANWVYVPTVSGFATGTGPTVAEATASSGLDISRILFEGGIEPTQNTNLVEQQRRFADTTVNQFIGQTTYTGGTFVFQFDQQGAAGSDGVKAWETFRLGVSGFFLRRMNVARATNFTAGQFVDVFKVETGPAMPIAQGSGENAEGAASASFALTADPIFKVAIQA
ncbi:hypothetical protein [Nocardioides sp.]|uniref:phage tail tube protein n=1 Tax=Nocardioides sp. TaxID=35761 RepID=UPI003514EAC1